MTNLESAARELIAEANPAYQDPESLTVPKRCVEALRAALPASEATGVLTREQAIEACLRKGAEAADYDPTAPEWEMLVPHVLAQDDVFLDESRTADRCCVPCGGKWVRFTRAVLAEAVRHPILADSPALRSKP